MKTKSDILACIPNRLGHDAVERAMKHYPEDGEYNWTLSVSGREWIIFTGEIAHESPWRLHIEIPEAEDA